MNTLRLLLLAGVCCLLVTGCRVSDHKNGNNDNVDIGTPFGSMHVKTSNSGPVAGLGIAIYPGAVPSKEKDGGSDSADVTMSFGGFHLGARGAAYKTTDDQDKVISFYKHDLARYGGVIECRGDKSVGQPTRTSQGLTCDSDTRANVNTDGHSSSELELRAGSPAHQHMVAVKSQDGGTKIGLVVLDLPWHHGSKDSE